MTRLPIVNDSRFGDFRIERLVLQMSFGPGEDSDAGDGGRLRRPASLSRLLGDHRTARDFQQLKKKFFSGSSSSSSRLARAHRVLHNFFL